MSATWCSVILFKSLNNKEQCVSWGCIDIFEKIKPKLDSKLAWERYNGIFKKQIEMNYCLESRDNLLLIKSITNATVEQEELIGCIIDR